MGESFKGPPEVALAGASHDGRASYCGVAMGIGLVELNEALMRI